MIRITLFILLAFPNSVKSQIKLFQPDNKESKQNILFGKHEHLFKVRDNYRIKKVNVSAGNVYEITESSFKYLMNAKISSGKVNFIIEYETDGKKNQDTLVFEFVPKTRYTCKVVGAKYYAPHKSYLVSATEFVKNNVQLEVFRDNKKIFARIECIEIIRIPKRGDGSDTFLISRSDDLCNDLRKSSSFGWRVSQSINDVLPKQGDRIFIERAIIEENNEIKKIEFGTSLMITD